MIADTYSCGTRLDAASLIVENRSLSVNLVAQSLLSGEYFRHDMAGRSINASGLDVKVSTFLHYISFATTPCLVKLKNRRRMCSFTLL